MEELDSIRMELIRSARELKNKKPSVIYKTNKDLHAKMNRDNKANELKEQGHIIICSRYPHSWEIDNYDPIEYLLFDGGLNYGNNLEI